VSSRIRARALTSVVALLLSVSIGLSAAEWFIRQRTSYGYITPEILRHQSVAYERSLFSRHVLPREPQIVTVGPDTVYRINSLGYRGPEFTRSKPPGVVRVMFYGGSSTFDLGQNADDDWPHRVGRRLQAGGLNVEAINAGVPGHATWDAAGRLFAEGHTFRPDYCVLYSTWNDLKSFHETQPLLRSAAPYEARERVYFEYQNGFDRFFSEHSQLYNRLRFRYYSFRLGVGPDNVAPEGVLRRLPADDSIADSAVAQFRMNIETFVDVARNAGAHPILALEARLAATTNTSDDITMMRLGYTQFTHAGLLHAYEIADRVYREVAAEKQVPLIEGALAMTGHREWLVDHVHLSREGAAKLSEIVSSAMAPLLRH
jgi:lysophospholipase L1-like esterase